MLRYTRGNLLEADVQALVNTVNTEGVMGKGIALMFKEAFPENFKLYRAGCKAGQVEIGRMFVTERHELIGPKWIINFPTKKHWRRPSKLEWIVEGIADLRRTIEERSIRSIAIPPLGSGNGGLDWRDVRREIEANLADLPTVDVLVYEPTPEYLNVAKRSGVQKLTPARAMVAELVRRYWVLGIECSLLEIQKLAWFLERQLERVSPDNPLQLKFEAGKYGPYAKRLNHLLDALDGSYLHCEKRIADAVPGDVIWFDDAKRPVIEAYLRGDEASRYEDALCATTALIDGFESPYGLELLATADWLLARDHCQPTVDSLREGLARWPGGADAAKRKLRLFDDTSLQVALQRLLQVQGSSLQPQGGRSK